MKITKEILQERQRWNLQQKIDHSLGAIDEFVTKVDGKAYISFSGGKDSTVLLDIARIIYPDIKACFINTGNEYPEIVYFVRALRDKGYNIDIIRPELTPKQVLAQHGFPLISKGHSEKIWYARNRPDSVRAKKCIEGWGDSGYMKLPKKYHYLLSEKYEVNSKCCQILKKNPAKLYEKQTGLKPILGLMATESKARTIAYLRRGNCNTFETKIQSTPLAIWTDKNIWEYIEKRKLKIAEIYRGGAQRTGCMFCGFGCQFADDNRLKLVYDLHRKFYDVFMNYTNNGVTYREAMQKFLQVNNLSLPEFDMKLF